MGIEAAEPPGAAGGESGRCGRGKRLPQEDGPRRPRAGTREQSPGAETRGLRRLRHRHHRRGGGRAGALRAAGGGGVGGRDRMGGPRGTLPGAVPQLTVPPSLMMIFLASMILRFAARFFFFPWVILPSSIPGATAATPGAAGPSGECRPATTAGPSRSGRPPPS